MGLMFWNGRLLFRNGTLAMDPRCCCTSTYPPSTCDCCKHAQSLCQRNCAMQVSISGAIAGSGLIYRVALDQCLQWFYDGIIALTNDCGGFPPVTVQTYCVGGTRCAEAGFAFGTTPEDIFGNCCQIVADTSRGAEADGWKSFTCDPYRLEYHFKTALKGAGPCTCGAGTAITVVIAEGPC